MVIPARTSFDPLAPAAKGRPSRVGTRSRLVRTGIIGQFLSPTDVELLRGHENGSLQSMRRIQLSEPGASDHMTKHGDWQKQICWPELDVGGPR